MRHRCVYYKVPRERVGQACTAVREVQRTWVSREPGLQAQLLLREDAAAAGPAATLMEVWVWQGDAAGAGSAPPAWHVLEDELARALGDTLIGVRHVEDFGPPPV